MAEKVTGIAALRESLLRARAAPHTAVVVIDTDPTRSTDAGGAWWDVPVAETSASDSVRNARRRYETERSRS